MQIYSSSYDISSSLLYAYILLKKFKKKGEMGTRSLQQGVR